MEEKLDLKETLEVLDAAGLLVETAGKALADGKLGLSDLVHLKDLVSDFSKLSAAVKDFDKVDDELKDLDEAEIAQLAVAAMALVKKVMASIPKKDEEAEA